MKRKRSLLTVLVGLAMLATPITAAAYDNNYSGYKSNSHPAHVSSSSNAATRGFSFGHNANRAVANSNTFRNNNTAAGRYGYANRGMGTVGNVDDYMKYGHNYRNYGGPGYYSTPAYAGPAYAAPGYPAAVPYAAAPYYGGVGGGYAGGCDNARRVINTYNRDRNTGHPAAAYDLLAQNQWAFHTNCGAAMVPMGGMFSGFGGGAPAYGNYGGYNGGYGQPYGGSSILAPLIQQFVR
jgi:hypothetical protein